MAFGKVEVWMAVAVGFAALDLGSEEVDLNLPEGFEAHRIYDVPVRTQGSWVCITFRSARAAHCFLPIRGFISLDPAALTGRHASIG